MSIGNLANVKFAHGLPTCHHKRDGPEGDGGRRSGPSAPLASASGVDPPAAIDQGSKPQSTPEAAQANVATFTARL
jgi:hypothetical protein